MSLDLTGAAKREPCLWDWMSFIMVEHILAKLRVATTVVLPFVVGSGVGSVSASRDRSRFRFEDGAACFVRVPRRVRRLAPAAGVGSESSVSPTLSAGVDGSFLTARLLPGRPSDGTREITD